MRKDVYDQQRGRCLWPTCGQWMGIAFMHAHEVIFRSAGGDPNNEANVIGLCGLCHGDLHVKVGGKLKRITGVKGTGLRFFERATGDSRWKEVV